METRHLVILGAVAAVLSGAVALTGMLEDRQEVTLQEGSYLLQGFNPEKVHGIYIKQGDEALAFKRRDERFILTGRYDYPVSNEQINRILKSIADIRCAERVTADERNHGALGVMGEKGSLVVRFFGESGQKMTGIVIGRDRPGFPGFYVRLEDERQVCLSTEALPAVSAKPVDYIRRDLPPGRKRLRPDPVPQRLGGVLPRPSRGQARGGGHPEKPAAGRSRRRGGAEDPSGVPRAEPLPQGRPGHPRLARKAGFPPEGRDRLPDRACGKGRPALRPRRGGGGQRRGEGKRGKRGQRAGSHAAGSRRRGGVQPGPRGLGLRNRPLVDARGPDDAEGPS